MHRTARQHVDEEAARSIGCIPRIHRRKGYQSTRHLQRRHGRAQSRLRKRNDLCGTFYPFIVMSHNNNRLLGHHLVSTGR